jgi:hypothetical protein
MLGGPEAVTVLLPVFFREVGPEQIRLLRRALASVHAQRFPSGYEILLIDDGSAEPLETLGPALGAEARALRFLRLPHNAGIAHALNRGLAEARSPLIARLDHDDWWLETKIEKQLASFRSDPAVTIGGTGMTLVTPAGEALSTHIRPGSWQWALDFLKSGGSPLPHGSVLARRDVFRLLGGYPVDPACEYCEDYALWADWLRFFKPGMIEEDLFRYTVSPSSVSVAHRERQIQASIMVRDRLQDLPAARIPDAMQEFASAVGCSLVEAGILAFKMWRYGLAAWLPRSATGPLELILFDRRVASGSRSDALEPALVVANPALRTARRAIALHAVQASGSAKPPGAAH